MKRRIVNSVLALSLSAAMAIGMVPSVPAMAASADKAAFDTEEFADPSTEYHPGVRWWWSGGAVEKAELKKEVEYLASKGFGYVEINPFNVTPDMGGVIEGTEKEYSSVYTPEFYELLDYAIGLCEEKGIIVDLNMGSGWNANSEHVTIADSMGNMALGRNTVKGADLSAGVAVPGVEESGLYTSWQMGPPKGNWSAENVVLQGVLIAEVTGTGSDLNNWNIVNEYSPIQKKYEKQTIIDVKNGIYKSASTLSGDTIQLTEDELAKLNADKAYEVVALYSVPSGGTAIDCVNSSWYAVDHMDADAIATYVNEWIMDDTMPEILEKHDNIRAAFNDSYEFYTDVYYTEELAVLAEDVDNNAVGYDFAKYLPLVYKQTSAAPYYMILMGLYGTNDTFLSNGNAAEMNRINYDYNALVNQKWMEGLQAFQSSLNEHGVLYRQEAYNPPIDVVGAAEYIDIPETEQTGEYDLKRVSSGAHLYGKNLVTCEQYTLGTSPFTNSLEQVKIGYDIMALAGVTNFFYHGYSYAYGEGTDSFGENNWYPFAQASIDFATGEPSYQYIGINLTEKNTIAKYWNTMNAYSARVNYMMQQGTPSKDVAYYIPLNGGVSSYMIPDAVHAMDYNGYSWDFINDDSIQNASTTVNSDGSISVNGGKMTYDSIVINQSAVPVETMEALKALASKGANIIFADVDINAMTIPGYADGNYAEADQKVSAMAAEIAAMKNGYAVNGMTAIADALKATVSAPVSYAYNENVRMVRRTLEDGSELAFISNNGTTDNKITVSVDDQYGACYWLDQNTGKVYPAQVVNGTVTYTIGASTDEYPGKEGQAGYNLTGNNSMAIALLCMPKGMTLDASAVSEGTPAVIDAAKADRTDKLDMVSLSVTADNFDGVIGGAAETKTYTQNILGKWNSADFQNGELQTIVSDGVYTMNYKVTSLEKKYVLQLGSVYTAAEVSVNGKNLGQICYTPFEMDVTSALVKGDNEIVVTVTPRKANRYYNNQNGQYVFKSLLDAGLEGPVSMDVYENPVKNQWSYENGKWFYYGADGELATGWQYVNGKWYYLDPATGIMQTGWAYVNGKWYYMSASGAMQTGWQYVNGKWYYMSASGAMQTGWQYVNGKWYYMSASGAMQTGWQYVNGKWYYMSASGAMQTGWQYVNGKWYYMYQSGAMAASTWIDGKYYVNASGAWVK